MQFKAKSGSPIESGLGRTDTGVFCNKPVQVDLCIQYVA